MLTNDLMNSRCRQVLLISVACLVLSACSCGHAGAQESKPVGNGASTGSEGLAFSSRDKETIRVFYGTRIAKLPGRSSASPGPHEQEFQLHVERGDRLPPAWGKRLKPFPAGLESRLPYLPPNYARGSIDMDILIVDTRTQRVMDILHNVLRF